MNTLLVSYDLKIPETSDDYKRVIEYMRSHGTRSNPLYSLWLLKTSKTCTEVRDELMGLTDSNDKLLVINITGDTWRQARLQPETVTWMTNNI